MRKTAANVFHSYEQIEAKRKQNKDTSPQSGKKGPRQSRKLQTPARARWEAGPRGQGRGMRWAAAGERRADKT